MKTYSVRAKRRKRSTRRAQPLRFGFRGAEVRYQQEKISGILRSYGVQARLSTGQSNDNCEQEADRVAEQVMQMPDPGSQRQSARNEGEAQIQSRPLADQVTPLVQGRDGSSREQALQAKLDTGEVTGVSPAVKSDIQSFRGGGQPLPGSERNFFEPRFGADFSKVRVHSDKQAAAAARSVNARAFTLGRHLVFGNDEYSPNTFSGRSLLAHELTHVLQLNDGAAQFSARQDSSSVSDVIQRKVKYINQVTGKDAAPFFVKFDKSVNKIANLIKGVKGAEAADLHQALTILRTLRAAGKITLWNTSGGMHYASYHNGEIRLHVVFGGRATASGTLVHEAIHALHADRFPRLQKMYEKVLAAGETTSRSLGILLLKYKAWTEYWAYRKAAVFENLRQEPEFFTDPHKSALSEKDVKKSMGRVRKATGKSFEPWKWNPPAKYKAIKK